MPMPRKPDPEKHCPFCGKQLTRKTFSSGRLEGFGSFLKRKYCDKICMAKAFIKEDVIKATLNQRARRFRGKKCETCGTMEFMHLHHVDGNAANNEPKNRMTLCRSCHSKWYWKHGGARPARVKVRCKVCGAPGFSLGLCIKHYMRHRTHGDPYLTKIRVGPSYVLIREDS